MLRSVCCAVLMAVAVPAAASDILIGTFAARSADSAIIGRVTSVYFDRVNENGGVAGHLIKLITYDTEGDRKKALDLTRKLFEVDHVSLITNFNRETLDAVSYYLRFRQVPIMYEAQDDLADEAALKAAALGEYIVKTKPGAKIALIFESGHSASMVDSFFFGLGTTNARRMITNMVGSDDWPGNLVERVSGSSADFLVIFGSEPFQDNTIKQSSGLRWHPILALTHNHADRYTPAIGVTTYIKPIELTADESRRWHKFKPSLNSDDANSSTAIEGFLEAQSIVWILRECLPDLAAACLRRTYASEKDYRIDHDYVGSIVHLGGETRDNLTESDAR